MIQAAVQRSDLDAPTLFPLRIVGETAEFVRLDEAGYRDASFLDERLLASGATVEPHPWPGVRALAPPIRPAHFIFHIGHCGSTLLSRLLGEHPAVFSVREPALLRDVATGARSGDLAPLLALFSRVWRPGQTALIKATSFVADIAPALMGLGLGRGRAILLGVTPPSYLRTILAGPASREEARALASWRRERLAERLGRRVLVSGEGEAIAMGWLCGALALQAAFEARSSACLRLDFDRLLAAPAAALLTALDHLGADPRAIEVEALARGPLMQRYAKGPEHAYDVRLRTELLQAAGRTEGEQVRAGMDWLQREARADPRVAAALQVSAATAQGVLAPIPGPE